MLNVQNKIVLKGQFNLAQGNALGFELGKIIVRAMKIFNEQLLFRTKRIARYFQIILQLRPKEVSLFYYLFLADDIHNNLFTQGGVSVVPPKTLPWAEIFWPFRP